MLLSSVANWRAALADAKKQFVAAHGLITGGQFPDIPQVNAVSAGIEEFIQGRRTRREIEQAIFDYHEQTHRWPQLNGNVTDLVKRAWHEMDARVPPPRVPPPERFISIFDNSGNEPLFAHPLTFACGDATSFWAEARDQTDVSIKNRVWAMDQAKIQQVGSKNMQANSLYDYAVIKSVGDAVREYKYGVCTTFALAAAKALFDADFFAGERVEIVSAPNHCFVIVNRAGDSVPTGGRFSFTPEMWQNGEHPTFVVDPWLGSLGHASVYETYKSYPNEGFFRTLGVTFESSAGADRTASA